MMHWVRTLSVVDCHAEGESGKVIVGGVGNVPGKTMFDKRVHLETHMDEIRKLVLFEPRGAVWHNANIILPSNHPDADMGFVILESTEYPAMSGSNTMCVATVLLETGILPMQEPVTKLKLESPAGIIDVHCDCKNGKVTRVKLVNQPSFCYYLDTNIEVPGLGTLKVDISYGGMTYVLVDARDVGLEIVPAEAREIIELGQRIKTAAAEKLTVEHPENPAIPGITQTEFCGQLRRENGELISRNSVVVSPGRCDRSPCGTGSSARLAALHAKKQIKIGETLIHESITGSKFYCAVEREATIGKYPAVIPSISGQAWVSGLYHMGLDPTDPYPRGFTLPDTWFSVI
jgi:proline racemase